MKTTALAGLVIDTPLAEPDLAESDHGQVWHWTGDGGALVGLVVGVGRQSTALDDFLLRAATLGHADSLVNEQLDSAEDARTAEFDIEVPGSALAHGVRVHGSRLGHPMLSTIIKLSDGGHQMSTVEIVTLDSADGAEFERAILDSLHVTA